jgi:hypothetical protein
MPGVRVLGPEKRANSSGCVTWNCDDEQADKEADAQGQAARIVLSLPVVGSTHASNVDSDATWLSDVGRPVDERLRTPLDR